MHSLSISSSLASSERNSVHVLSHGKQITVNRIKFCSMLLIQTRMIMKKVKYSWVIIQGGHTNESHRHATVLASAVPVRCNILLQWGMLQLPYVPITTAPFLRAAVSYWTQHKMSTLAQKYLARKTWIWMFDSLKQTSSLSSNPNKFY